MVLLGDGPLRQQLASQYGHLITFLPPVAWTEVPGIMALADGLVLPSLSEPWGLVVNEAMVCGLPVLVSNRCGCVADLVEEGRNGFTFSPDSPAEMETALQNLMQLPETERHRLGGHSKQLIQAFTPQRAAAEMWAGFRKIHHEHS